MLRSLALLLAAAALRPASSARAGTAPRAPGRAAQPGVLQLLPSLGADLAELVLSLTPGPTELAAALGGMEVVVPRRGLRLETEEAVRDVKFFTCGQRLLTLDGLDSIVVWSLATGRPIVRFDTNLLISLFEVQVFPDGDRVIATGNGSLPIWSAASGQVLQVLEPPRLLQTAHRSVRVSPCGTFVVSGVSHANSTFGDPVLVWNVGSGEVMHTLWHPNQDRIQSMELSPCGTRLVTGGYEGVFLWDPFRGELLHELGGIGPQAWIAAVSRHGARVFGWQQGTVFVFDGNLGGFVMTLPIENDVNGFAALPTGDGVVTFEDPGLLSVWNHTSGDIVRTLGYYVGVIRSIAASPGAVAACTVTVRLVEVDRGRHELHETMSASLWEVASNNATATVEHQVEPHSPGDFDPMGRRGCKVAVGRSASILDWLRSGHA